MSDLNLKGLLKFWLPLAGTWLMMSVEGPFLAAIIARLADPKFNLAAYGVAFALALIIEAPVIMMMTAATALVKDSQSLNKLFNFTLALNTVITCFMLVLIIPKIFFFITLDLIGLVPDVARLTHVATIILIPWPSAIGFRRFYQGVLIANHATRRVAYGTVIRVISMGLTAFSLYMLSDLPGVYIGTISLSTGVIMEALSARFMVHGILKAIHQGGDTEPESLTYKKIKNFYSPLALTSILTLGVHPIVTFFVGKSVMALESLAVLPVVSSFVFLFRGLGISYQEAAITLLGSSSANDRLVTRFAVFLGATLSSILILTAFTPLSGIWFAVVSGLSAELTTLAITPLMVLGLFPATSVLISFQRARLVKAGNTGPITGATIVEVLGIVIVLYIGVVHLSWMGAVAAASSFMVGRLAANIYLQIKLKTT